MAVGPTPGTDPSWVRCRVNRFLLGHGTRINSVGGLEPPRRDAGSASRPGRLRMFWCTKPMAIGTHWETTSVPVKIMKNIQLLLGPTRRAGLCMCSLRFTRRATCLTCVACLASRRKKQLQHLNGRKLTERRMQLILSEDNGPLTRVELACLLTRQQKPYRPYRSWTHTSESLDMLEKPTCKIRFRKYATFDH